LRSNRFRTSSGDEVMDILLKILNHTIPQQAKDKNFEARTFVSPSDERLYLVLRHPRDSGNGYAYYVMECVGTHEYIERQVEASAKEYLGVPWDTSNSDWWNIWPEPGKPGYKSFQEIYGLD
jgi:hypothetical protein